MHELPHDVLERLLIERLGEEDARAILAEHRAASRRYARAQRVARARHALQHLEVRARYENGSDTFELWVTRRIAALRDLIDHADEYIAGTWSPTRPTNPTRKKTP